MTWFFIILMFSVQGEAFKPPPAVAMTSQTLHFVNQQACEMARGQLLYLTFGVSGIPLGTGSKVGAVDLGAHVTPCIGEFNGER